MKRLKKLIEYCKNFTIYKFKGCEISSYKVAFDVLMKIDSIINGNFLSLDENDVKILEEDGKIDLVLGTQGYSAQFFKDERVLKMVFIEGGLE